MVRNFTNTAVFDLLSPLKANTGVHEHSEADKELIHQCFHTINPDYLNWCVPGFYEVLKALVGLEFPISVLTFYSFSMIVLENPLKELCLELAFADCSYKSRILIKDLLYDFAYLFVNIPLRGAPQGKTGELGPPISAIRECISSVNATGSDSCVLGIVEYLHKVFIEGVEKPEPIISLDKAKTSMSCLAELLKPCDLPMKLFLLKRIANISNVDIHFLMETFLIRPGWYYGYPHGYDTRYDGPWSMPFNAPQIIVFQNGEGKTGREEHGISANDDYGKAYGDDIRYGIVNQQFDEYDSISDIVPKYKTKGTIKI
ncbi:uncharacterized protein CEXT_236111 [Caerostris extrusa]|uniref:Uncharacterized protein n=1 Tax=Caerostris extrusa TaxID=172846 RepID=A0AAV4SI75_CAEEX|nr:uncharacterized protein CEXT_236111 [Caerostris extrusa]